MELVHGEYISDGVDTSSGVDMILYLAGSATVRTVASTEFLYITSVRIMCEDGGNIALVADAKTAGQYIIEGAVDAKGGIVLNLAGNPYGAPKGQGLKFFGAAANKNTCIVEGFIKSA